MSFPYKTPTKAIDRIYSHIQNGAKVVTRVRALKRGDIYFAVPVHRPRSNIKRMLWNIWGIFEIYAPRALSRLLRMSTAISRHTPFAARVEAFTEQPLNGNIAAPEAVRRGAGVVVVDSRHYRGGKCLYVTNTNEALSDLAHHHRQQFSIKCVGITGSCGKTTTKELVAAIMAKRYRTTFTTRNFNSEEYVAQTILDIGPDTEAAVIEIAADGTDSSIARKCAIAIPNIGIITVIGKAHLVGFGGPSGVEAAKRQLFDFIAANNGYFFANLDDPRIAAISAGYDRIWTYGEDPAAKTRGIALVQENLLCVRYSLTEQERKEYGRDSLDIRTQLFGRYNLSNVLAAIAVGRHLGISLDAIRSSIEGYCPSNHRSQIIRHGEATLIMDAYNANPTSMNAALDSFAEIQSPRKIVILGDMLELGESSDDEHRAIIRKLEKMQLDSVIVVGNEFAKHESRRIDHTFKSVTSLLEWMADQELGKASILIKGSHAIGLESILTGIAERA